MKLQNIFLPILAISACFGMSTISSQTNQALNLDEPLGLALESKSKNQFEFLDVTLKGVYNNLLPFFPGELWQNILEFTPKDCEFIDGFSKEIELPYEFYDSIVKDRFKKVWDTDGDFNSILDCDYNYDFDKNLSKERFEYLMKSALARFFLSEDYYLDRKNILPEDYLNQAKKLLKLLKFYNRLMLLEREDSIKVYEKANNETSFNGLCTTEKLEKCGKWKKFLSFYSRWADIHDECNYLLISYEAYLANKTPWNKLCNFLNKVKKPLVLSGGAMGVVYYLYSLYNSPKITIISNLAIMLGAQLFTSFKIGGQNIIGYLNSKYSAYLENKEELIKSEISEIIAQTINSEDLAFLRDQSELLGFVHVRCFR